MSEQSAKPYLIRAICEWCADNSLTPYLAVKVDRQTRVPTSFVKNGEIVLNISAGATRRLTVDNDRVQFTARFNGASHEVSVPMVQSPASSRKKPDTALRSRLPLILSLPDAATAPVAAVSANTTPPGQPRRRPKHLFRRL
jgi:stringent starvation protein B